MTFWSKRVRLCAVWAAAVLIGSQSFCNAQDLRLESAGARFGFNPFGAGSHFYQAEAFANWVLPFAWDLGAQWHLRSRADVSAGWLGEADINAALVTAGPTVVFVRENLPISFECGLSPTLISHSSFRDKDFGEAFQFTSHFGINWDLSAHIRLSYRLQHMSNGGFSSPNPGLNLNVFGLSYLF